MDALREQLALLPEYLTAHLQLTLLALLLGASVSIPLGIFITRRKSMEGPLLGTASVIQTIPSLALLAIMVPTLEVLAGVLAWSLGVEMQTIGFTPAIIALTLYSVLPMLRNTVTGIEGVSPAIKEAARGVGMTPSQQLRQVVFPLALPVIVAGVRTSTVWVTGMATLSTPVGAPSLGNYIFAGLQTRNMAAVAMGCIGAAGLALLLDGLVLALERGIRQRRRKMLVASLAVLGLLYGYTAITLVADALGRGRADVTIGAKTFTEQYILAEILAGKVSSRTGLETGTMSSLGSTVAFDALASGDIDVYVDYSGTLWATILKRETIGLEREKVLAEVGVALEAEHGVLLIGPLGFENTYALAMKREKAAALGIRRISDLAAHAPSLAMGSDYEFFSRPEWATLHSTYGLELGEKRSMDPSLMYEAVANGDVDVISAFSTDGRIAAYDLVVLEDDRSAIPPYDAVILVSADLAREHPDAVVALKELVGTIDADAMRGMNLAVDEKGASPAAVAAELLGLPPAE